MKLKTAAVLMLVAAFAGCGAETEPAKNVKAGIADLNAKVSVDPSDSGQFWWEFRKRGGPWIPTVRRDYGGVKVTSLILTEKLRTN